MVRMRNDCRSRKTPQAEKDETIEKLIKLVKVGKSRERERRKRRECCRDTRRSSSTLTTLPEYSNVLSL